MACLALLGLLVVATPMISSAEDIEAIAAAATSTASRACNPRCNSAAGEKCDSRSRTCVCNAPSYATCTSGCAKLSSDPNNCGACDNACAAPTSVCIRGVCSCPTGQTLCNDVCVKPSVAFASDDDNCGACGKMCSEMGPNYKCMRGKCACPSPFTGCSAKPKLGLPAVCTNLAIDTANCGGCGKACKPGLACVGKKCKPVPCPTERPLSCAGACINNGTDVDNCGTCGNTCGPDGVCNAGSCECAAGADYCSDVCTVSVCLALSCLHASLIAPFLPESPSPERHCSLHVKLHPSTPQKNAVLSCGCSSLMIDWQSLTGTAGHCSI